MHIESLSCHYRTRNLVTAIGLSVVLLLSPGSNTQAQDAPPIPDGGDTRPRDPTPEELERMQQAEEARWRHNAEFFRPWLLSELVYEGEPVTTLAEVDEVQRKRLMQIGEDNRLKQQTSQRAAEDWTTSEGNFRALDHAPGQPFKLVGFDEGRPRYHKYLGLHEATVTKATELWPGGSLGLTLSGAGTTVGIWDAGDVLATHAELSGRIVDKDGATVLDDHATSVAGTIGSAGANTAAKGVAFQTTIHSYDSDGDTGEMPAAVANDALRLSNHSYSEPAGWQGSGSGQNWIWYGDTSINFYEDYHFGFYGPEAHGIDGIVYNAPYYLPVWAAGNETGRQAPSGGTLGNEHIDAPPGQLFFDFHNQNGGTQGYDTILPHGVAKNVLTVGAVSLPPGGYSGPSSVTLWSSSSTGPADQRIKPDLVAPGVGVTSSSANGGYITGYTGTSQAAPVVTGLLNLWIQRHTQLHGSNRPLLNSAVKGLAIHTADECGAHAGPDYKHGWGLPNAERGVGLINANVTTGTSSSYVAKPHIKEVVLVNGSTISFTVRGTSTQMMKITAAWTDPTPYPLSPALNPTTPVLVNNLDLRVTGPGGTFHPWSLNPAPGNRGDAASRNGDNDVDNVEQVQIDNPSDATYTVWLTHKGALEGGLQRVSLILSGIVPQPKELRITHIAQTGANQMTLQFPSFVGQSYKIQYIEEVTASNWTDATPEVVAVAENTAVNVAYSQTNPHRFYRVITVD
ncbi:MAG TPA: hypothetical protein DCY13_01600 [Verrucomicrobiales bacterium]|nr:hypothetical protein [Verrucomicrobiales bacterium]